MPLVAGTDDIAGFTLHRELELYVKAGIPAGEALRIATWNGARTRARWRRSARSCRTSGRRDSGRRRSDERHLGDPQNQPGDEGGEVFYPAEIYEALGVKRFVDPPPVQRIELNHAH